MGSIEDGSLTHWVGWDLLDLHDLIYYRSFRQGGSVSYTVESMGSVLSISSACLCGWDLHDLDLAHMFSARDLYRMALSPTVHIAGFDLLSIQSP